MRTGTGYGIELWSSPQWHARAVSWLDDRLAGTAATRTGEVGQPHLRPWGTVLQAPTTQGSVWLKATGPANAFEVGLYGFLNRVAPARVPPVIATDRSGLGAARRWRPDAG